MRKNGVVGQLCTAPCQTLALTIPYHTMVKTELKCISTLRRGFFCCTWAISKSHIAPLDLGRAPYVSYGVKYIDLVSLVAAKARPSHNLTSRPLFFKMAQNLDLRCLLISDPGTFGVGAKPRLHTFKPVTYHEQNHTL